jgi:hypothetical protein
MYRQHSETDQLILKHLTFITNIPALISRCVCFFFPDVEFGRFPSSFLSQKYFKEYLQGGRVTRGSLYYLFIVIAHDLLTSADTLTGTFADDMAIFSSHENPITAANNLQNHLLLIEKWMKKWKIKVNEPHRWVPTLSWWWGLRAPETLRAMPAVA